MMRTKGTGNMQGLGEEKAWATLGVNHGEDAPVRAIDKVCPLKTE